MDVLMRVEPYEVKVDDFIFKKNDLTDPYRVISIVRAEGKHHDASVVVNTGRYSGDFGDVLWKLESRKRYIISRQIKVVTDGSLL